MEEEKEEEAGEEEEEDAEEEEAEEPELLLSLVTVMEGEEMPFGSLEGSVVVVSRSLLLLPTSSSSMEAELP